MPPSTETSSIFQNKSLCALDSMPVALIINFIIFIAAVIAFSPLAGDHHQYCIWAAPLTDKVLSYHYRQSQLSSVIAAIPMLIDIILDSPTIFRSFDELSYWCTRFVLFVSLTFPVVAFSVAGLQTGSSRCSITLLAICVGQYHLLNGTGCIIAFILQHLAELKLSGYYFRVQLCFLFCSTLVGLFCLSISMFGNYLSALSVASFFMALSMAQALILFCIWLRYAYLAKQENSSLNQDEICISQYLVLLVMNIFIPIISILAFGPVQKWELIQLCFIGYYQVAFTVVVLMLPGRTARVQASRNSQQMDENAAFIRYISHEIRTPLNTVSVGLNYMKAETDALGKVIGSTAIGPISEAISDVNDSCSVALRILDDLLTFDKLEGGKLVMEMEDMDPIEFVTDCFKTHKTQATQQELQFTLNCIGDSDDIWNRLNCRLDKYKFAQVMRNLISNAIKFTSNGGTIEIRAAAVAFYDWPTSTMFAGKRQPQNSPPVLSVVDDSENQKPPIFRIEIIDSGQGISAENQKKLFGQYVQFNADTQKENGSGLGLWISRGIVELHGGRIGATSDGEGRGAKFFVEVPLYRKAQPNAAPVVLADTMDARRAKKRRDARASFSGSFLETASFLAPKSGATQAPSRVDDALMAARLAIVSPRPEPSSRNPTSTGLTRGQEDSRPKGRKGVARKLEADAEPADEGNRNGELLASGAISTGDAADAEDSQLPAQVAVDIITSKWESGLNFLVVDDSKPTRKVVRRLLSCHGHKSAEAENGLDFLRVMEEAFAQNAANGLIDLTTTYDVILIDDNMPDMNGPEAAEKIRAKGYKGLIVGLTGHTLAEDIDYFKRMGASSVLSKPLNLDALKQVVTRFYDER